MNTDRPKVFFDITADGAKLGRIKFELYSDIVPITAEKRETDCTTRGVASIGLSLTSCSREGTSPTTMVQGESRFTGTNSKMKIAKSTMIRLVYFPWQMQGRTPMEVSFLLPLWYAHGWILSRKLRQWVRRMENQKRRLLLRIVDNFKKDIIFI